MDRETKTLTLKSGKEVVMKTYLTARERNALRDIFLENLKIDAAGGKAEVKEMNGGVVGKSEEKLIELAVVSYDGSTENILGRLLDNRPDDYDEIVAEAGKVNSGNFSKAK